MHCFAIYEHRFLGYMSFLLIAEIESVIGWTSLSVTCVFQQRMTRILSSQHYQ